MDPNWLLALAGGALIGLAAAGLWWSHGQVAGISGIFAGALQPRAPEFQWKGIFVAGLIAGGVLMFLFSPQTFANTSGRGLPLLAGAGLLVGFGTRLGSGCTSGHGVCGISRFSARSIAATLTFIATGAIAVLLVGGVS